jgi:predicted phage baseplate assembly protein
VLPSAVARGNVVLVDHGLTTEDPGVWPVEAESGDPCCLCEGANTEVDFRPKRLAITLSGRPMTHAAPLVAEPAGAAMRQDPRAAVPAVWLTASPPAQSGSAPQTWRPARDLLSCGPNDLCFAVEIDDEGFANLRFGDGLQGYSPQPGWTFRAGVRVGNGTAGNTGRDSIVWMARRGGGVFSGIEIRPRNPLPAMGGTAPETIEHVKLYAPRAYGRVLERAVTGADYAQLAGEDSRVQGAFAELAWTGSWYEASVALDAIARYGVEEIAPGVQAKLEKVRRIGHDLRLVAARQAPLEIEIEVCVEPGHLRGAVEKAVREVLTRRFQPDALRFGEDISSSPIIAAVQAVDGVAHVEMKRFARLYATEADAERSLEDNVIAIAPDEIAQLDADANFPERGSLTVVMKGGR